MCCKMDLSLLPILSPCKMKKPFPQGAIHALELQIVALGTSSRCRQSFPSSRARRPWAGVVRAVLTELLECSSFLGSLIVACRWWRQKQGPQQEGILKVGRWDIWASSVPCGMKCIVMHVGYILVTLARMTSTDMDQMALWGFWVCIPAVGAREKG